MTLYDITGEAAALQAAFDQAETPEEMEEALASYDGIMDDLDRKAEGYAKLIQNWKAEAKALRDEEKRLAARRKARENGVARLTDCIKNSMDFLGIRSLSAGIFKLSIQKNGGKAPVVIDDEGAIPEEYWEVTKAVNKSKLYEAMAVDGEIIDGAHIGEPGESLRIK